MSMFTDMADIRAAARRGDVLSDEQVRRAADIVMARPSGYTRFAAQLIYALGQRLLAEHTASDAQALSA
jgi:hypothetical protein